MERTAVEQEWRDIALMAHLVHDQADECWQLAETPVDPAQLDAMMEDGDATRVA